MCLFRVVWCCGLFACLVLIHLLLSGLFDLLLFCSCVFVGLRFTCFVFLIVCLFCLISLFHGFCYILCYGLVCFKQFGFYCCLVCLFWLVVSLVFCLNVVLLVCEYCCLCFCLLMLDAITLCFV